jgi:hypothetical protein
MVPPFSAYLTRSAVIARSEFFSDEAIYASATALLLRLIGGTEIASSA